MRVIYILLRPTLETRETSVPKTPEYVDAFAFLQRVAASTTMAPAKRNVAAKHEIKAPATCIKHVKL